VQASAVELKAGLASMGALEVDGHWRIVEESYLAEVVQLVLGLLIENDWPYTAIPEGDCVEQLPDYCPHVVRHCLAFYGHAEGEGSWRLDETKVSAWVANRLLCPSSGEAKQWRKEEFLEVWDDDTPAGISPELRMLQVCC
jgi:sister chromatid cohesion protein DCC1